MDVGFRNLKKKNACNKATRDVLDAILDLRDRRYRCDKGTDL